MFLLDSPGASTHSHLYTEISNSAAMKFSTPVPGPCPFKPQKMERSRGRLDQNQVTTHNTVPNCFRCLPSLNAGVPVLWIQSLYDCQITRRVGMRLMHFGLARVCPWLSLVLCAKVLSQETSKSMHEASAYYLKRYRLS